jgi:tRNA uridine 5-carboxymethylaminomethyl modification enzyme
VEDEDSDFIKKWLCLVIEEKALLGVRTSLGVEIRAKSVVLTNGTFKRMIHIGEKQFGGGRAGESAAYGI